jgi:hypothetical protein
MIYKPIPADGWWHCPRNFFGHDAIVHPSGIFGCVLSPSIYSPSDRLKLFERILELHPDFISDMVATCKDMLPLYCQLQQEIYGALEKITDPDQKKIYSFFAFLDFHEKHQSLTRILEVAQDSCIHNFDGFSGFLNPNYYKGMYPDAVQKLPDAEIIQYLKKQYADYKQYIIQNLSQGIKQSVESFDKKLPKQLFGTGAYPYVTTPGIQISFENQSYEVGFEAIFLNKKGMMGDQYPSSVRFMILGGNSETQHIQQLLENSCNAYHVKIAAKDIPDLEDAPEAR